MTVKYTAISVNRNTRCTWPICEEKLSSVYDGDGGMEIIWQKEQNGQRVHEGMVKMKPQKYRRIELGRTAT